MTKSTTRQAADQEFIGTVTADGLVSSGNVGIGTSSPNQLLELKDNTANSGPLIRLSGSGQNAPDNLLGGIEIVNNDTSNSGPNTVVNIKAFSRTAAGAGGYLTFGTHDSTGGEGSQPTERMRIDSSGRVTMPNQPSFHALAQSTNNIDCGSSPYIIPYNGGTSLNTGNNFNNATGKFTAPVNGVYHFTANTRVDSFTGSYCYLTLEVNGSTRSRDLSVTYGSYINRNVSATVYMSANDTAHCYLRNSGDNSINVDKDSYFSGHLIG